MSDLEFKNKDVEREYQRWVAIMGPADNYYGKFTIGIHEALRAHFLLIDFFVTYDEGVGGVGPKDANMLHSALDRQFVGFGGKIKWNDRIDVCATLMYGLIKKALFRHDVARHCRGDSRQGGVGYESRGFPGFCRATG